jgi:putative nucleotidyltransferase-like protein
MIIANMSHGSYARVARLAAQGRGVELVGALRQLDAPAAEVAATLRAHHLSMLVRSALDGSDASDVGEMRSALDAVRPLRLAPRDDQLRGFDQVRRGLEAAGMPVLLLKGRYLGERLYGAAAASRPQFDVDVLVRARHHRAAARALVASGFRRTFYDMHATTFTRGTLQIDLHRYLRWAPAYRIDEDAIWQSALTVPVGDVEARSLTDEYTLLLLVLAAFEDLGQGMARLKQLLDVHLLLRDLDEGFDWEAFFEGRARENLSGVTCAVLALVVSLFEETTELPRLVAALARRGCPCGDAQRRLALALTFAPRKCPESLAWFKEVYPGAFSHYLLWFWLGGFPANLRGVSRTGAALTVALGRRRSTGS